MGKQEEQTKIVNDIDKLISELESINLNSEIDQETIHSHLDSFQKLEISISGFIDRFGENNWSSWGPARFTKVKALVHSLEAKLNQLNRSEITASKIFSRNMAIASAIFAAISAIAAIYSIFSSLGSGG